MKKIKKIFQRVVIYIFCIALIVPVVPQAEADNQADWSRVDWEQEVLLPQDLDAFYKEFNELDASGKSEELAALKPQMRKMKDPEVLRHFNAPVEVQMKVLENTVVEEFIAPSDDKKVKMDEYMPPQNILDIKKTKQLKLKNTKSYPIITETKPETTIRIIKNNRSVNRLFNVTMEGIIQNKTFKSADPNLKQLISSLFAVKTAYAAWALPLIAYYEGLENNTMDLLLYYLSYSQHDDGSFGEYNKYELTAEIALLLSSINKTNNDQFAAAVQYLTDATPQNNREKAIKARLMYGLGLSYQSYLNELAAVQNTDGGFGLYNYYQSDVLTTLEVALAFYVSGYSIHNALPKSLFFVANQINSDGSMYYTENSEAAYYLINRTAYYLYPFRSMVVAGEGGINIVIQDKIDSLLSYLGTNYDEITQNLYGSEDVIDKAMALSSFKIYETEKEKQKSLLDYLKNDQYIDGSFGNSLYSTVEAMRALRQSDLVITNISSSGTLVNKSAATFQLTVENRGYAYTNQAYIYTFIDNFDIAQPIDLLAEGVTIGPGETAVINITYPNTTSFIGSTEVKIYIEDENESNYNNNWIANNFTFASAPDNTPALPMYFIAQQHTISGVPAVNFRWQKKADPNRLNYVVGYRDHGTTQWYFYGIADSWNGAFMYGIFDEGREYDITTGVLHHDQTTVTYFTNYTTIRATGSETLYRGNTKGYFSEKHAILPYQRLFSYGQTASTDLDGEFVFENVPNGTNAAWMDEEYYEKIVKKYQAPQNQTVENVRLFSRLVPDTEKPVITQFIIRFKPNFIVMNQHTVEFLVAGTDNVGLEEADIYLYSPDSSSWDFLRTESFNKQTSLTSPWYVSEEMLGLGYKVKAVIRDYQGNESDPVEWGPFEIIDGTAPSFELVSPNGGEVWGLGANEDIVYLAQSPNGITNINLWLQYPYNKTQTINFNGTNTGMYNYTVPLSYNLVSDNVKVKISGKDAVTYLTSEDTSDDYFSIVDTTPVPAAPWGDPKTIGDAFAYNPDGGEVSMPMIKYGSNGIGHIIYKYTHDTHAATDRVITTQLYYLTYNSGTGVMSQPVKIYESAQTTDAGLDGFTSMQEMQMVLDSNNRPHILWVTFTYSGSNCLRFNTQEIYYMYYTGAVWTIPQNISGNTTSSRLADLTSDHVGNVYSAWIDGTTYDEACNASGQRTIYYRKKASGSNWSVIEQLAATDAPYYPQLAVTADSRVHLVYYSTPPNVLKHMYKASTWTTPTEVASGDLDFLQLEKGTSNSLHIIFRKALSLPSRYGAVYMNFINNIWSSESIVSPPIENTYADYPQLAIDENNVPHAMYEIYEGSHRSIYWTTVLNNIWQTPQKIHRESQKMFNSYYRIAYAGNNKMSAVWQLNNEFRQKIIINHADLTTYNPNLPPTFQFIEPDGNNDIADASYTITWTDNDLDDSTIINLFYDTDDSGQDGKAINLAVIYEDDTANSYTWDTRNIPEGTYYIYAVVDDGVNSPVVVYSTHTVTIVHHTVYEDAENSNTHGWTIFDNIPAGAQVNNIYDAVKGSRVIELVGAGGTLNGFRFFKDDYTPWNNTEHFVIQWDHKIGSDYAVYIDVTTNQGNYAIYYTPAQLNKLGTGNSVHHALGLPSQNNTWQTITRDLQADLHAAQPNVDIVSVNSFIVRAVGRFDNIKLMRHYPEGLDSDGDGISDRDEIYVYKTNQNLVDTDGDGLSDYDEINVWHTNPTSVDTDGDGYNDNVELLSGTNPNDPDSYPAVTVYEDAENGNTKGWSIFDNSPAGALIQNVYDAAHGSRVIALTGSGTANGYRLYTDFNKPWNNTKHFVIQWDHKFSENYYIYVDVNTTAGRRYLYYSPTDTNMLGSSSSVHHGLGVTSRNGTWQTFTRDLVADLHDAQPNIDILAVNSLLVRGSGRMDNIKLMINMP